MTMILGSYGPSEYALSRLYDDPTTSAKASDAGQNGTTTAAGAGPQSGAFDWTTAASGETSHTVIHGDTLWALSIRYYGVANDASYASFGLANPTVFSKKVPPQDQILPLGPLKILSPDRLGQIQKVEQDYRAVIKATTAASAAQRVVETANSRLPQAVGAAQSVVATANGRLPHAGAQAGLTSAQHELTQTQTQLNKDLKTWLLPDQTQEYQPNVGDAAAAELTSILPDPGLEGYIDTALHSLHSSLNQLFGNPADPHSLRVDIQTGNWIAAEHVEEQEIAAAGKGLADPAKRQAAGAAVALGLVKSGPADPQYLAGINKAFDNAVVQPMVGSLNGIYADPASQPHTAGSVVFDSRAGAFAGAFKADMESSTLTVRVALMQDLLAEKDSPLLSVAGEIRAASSHPFTGNAYLLQYWRQRAAGIPALYPRAPPHEPSGTDLWQISSTEELDQAYRDLAAGTDLAAIGNTPGTATGMTFQVAQALLGDSKFGRTNLQVLMPSIQNAAAEGNITLSVEIATILAQSPGSAAQTQASTVLDSASKGVAQLQSKIARDTNNLHTLPADLQVPVQSVALAFSDPQTTINATGKFLQVDAAKGAEVQSKLQRDLAALDADGQAVVRVNAVMNYLDATSVAGLAGAGSLQVAGSQLSNDPNAYYAVSLSPTAQFQLSLEQQQQAYADAVRGTIPGQSWTAQRGLPYVPPGILWITRDLQSIYGQMRASGPSPGLLPTSAAGTAFNMLDLVQKFGGAGYLLYLGLTHPDQYNLYVQFALGLGVGALPGAAQLGAGLTQKLIVGSDLSAIPRFGQGLTDLLSTGGKLDSASLFALGIGSGVWRSALSTAAGVAWAPMMYEWAAEEFQAHKPIDGVVVAGMGSSYLIPVIEALTDSAWAWAGPVGAVIDIGGAGYLLYDTFVTADHQIHQYDSDIKNILLQTGAKDYVADALSRPDSQGLAAVVRLGQIFDALPYYNTSNKQQNDQRRLTYLNSLSREQAALLSEALVHLPVDKNGQVAKIGNTNLLIKPPPASMSPDQVVQYYQRAFRAHGLPPPPDPNHLGGLVLYEDEYLRFYEVYTEGYAQTGQRDWSTGVASQYAEANLRAPTEGGLLSDTYALMPKSIQGFMYYADAYGLGLRGAMG